MLNTPCHTPPPVAQSQVANTFAATLDAKSVRAQRKASASLKGVLLNSGLALPLMILVAQQRNGIVFYSELRHLKIISELYDKTHETLAQVSQGGQ